MTSWATVSLFKNNSDSWSKVVSFDLIVWTKCLRCSALETAVRRFAVLSDCLSFPLDLDCQAFHIRKFTKTTIIKTVALHVPVVLMCETVPPCCWRRQYRCLSPHCYWRHLGKPSNRTVVSRLLIALSFAVLEIQIVTWDLLAAEPLIVEAARSSRSVSQTPPLLWRCYVFRLIWDCISRWIHEASCCRVTPVNHRPLDVT